MTDMTADTSTVTPAATGAATGAAVPRFYLAEEDDEDEYEEDDSFWGQVGIDPIKIVTSANEYLTLRCYLGDDPVFLGTKGKIFVFTSARSLSRFLADDNTHDLADLSTFDEVRTEATNGSLEFDVIDDNVYVLPGLAEDIIDGIAYDGRSPNAYLDSLPIGLKGEQIVVGTEVEG
mgnify:CR=1 FL=1